MNVMYSPRLTFLFVHGLTFLFVFFPTFLLIFGLVDGIEFDFALLLLDTSAMLLGDFLHVNRAFIKVFDTALGLITNVRL